ncbi:MAG: PAS domain-containing protein [Actinobacteria bacterium]|nr:PAS domain-containing protein [Actinomycetota bacterium]
MFILVVTPLFLVAGFTVVALSFGGGSGDSLNKAVTLVIGVLSFGAAVVLPVYSMNEIRSRNRRDRRLEQAMRSAADGELAHRLETPSNDGEDTLAESYNHMMVSMQGSLSMIRTERGRFRSIHQAITDGIIIFDTHGHVVSANPAAEAAIGLLEKQIRGTGHIGISDVEQCVNAPDIVPDASKVKCWLEKNCEHGNCPSFESDDLRCWLQCGTYCHNEIQGTFRQKRDACERCEVYLKNGLRIVEFERTGSNYSVTISPILDDSGSEEGRMAVFHDITALVTASESLKRRNLELSVLNEVGSSLSESFDDIEEVLEEALANVAHAVGVCAGAILLRQDGGGSLRLAAHMGISPQASVFMRLLDLSEELDEFMDPGTGLIDVDAFFRRYRSAQLMIAREGFKKPVMAPISTRGTLIGVLILMDSEKDEYHETDIRILRSLAAQIGVAAQNQDYFHNIARAKNAWETTFDSMTDGVSVHDMNFRIVHANRAMAELLGTTKAELVGSTCYKAIHHSGMPFIQCPQKEVIQTGESVSIEIEDPALKKFFRLSMNPVFDSEGSVIGLVHVLRDITERKLLREQLLQSEKMAAVGQLVSGVAHELNNPLTGVIGFSQLMLRKCEENRGSPSPDDIRSILNEAQRASKIVQNLMAFSRKYKPQKTLVDINQAIRSVLDLRAYEMTLKNIRIETVFDAGLPRAMADLHQIEQVILNLLNNAIQAVVDSGHPGIISVSTRADGDKVLLSVTDNGDGIAAEDEGRIFDPFFTTREVGQGPGLGLSICYGIIEEHGGNIRVANRKGNGATLTVELPAAAQASVDIPEIGMDEVADMKGLADNAG